MKYKFDQFIINSQGDLNSIIRQSNYEQNQETFPEEDDNYPSTSDDLRTENPSPTEFGQDNDRMSFNEEDDFIINDKYSTKDLLDMKINPFINPKNMNYPLVKEDNIKGIFHLFTKRSNDQINYIEIYSKKPLFEVLKLDKTGQRKLSMDSISKKVREKVIETLINIFGDNLKKLSISDFNQNGNITYNKENLNMILKDLLKNILLANIRKKTKNNDYILTEEDENFIESLANNDERKKYILNMKMEDIYNEFFESQEYIDLIVKLRKEENEKGNDGYFYIHKFIEKNEKYVEYYQNAKERKKKDHS